ncbi:prenyltransferase [Mycobacterium sp. CBMA271]|uniref:prenyltransferase n=1 Tax=unclassified Mycobacteroides TaxID=2618759 RepID=UPI0012DCACAF|nr:MULTISPECIES: prenyltransferase [unclassified Mycobacteroides]MUM16575.1 hypothetical protein [Mycobacteroides sp. CBMA 326]MUM22118.1 prenyltransferase [Mycobacteroides sp. CBMA 271]
MVELSGRQRAEASWRHSVRIRRPEFLSSTLATVLVAAFLAAQSWRDLFTLPFLAAVLAVIQGEWVCNMVNCLADREQDAAHKSGQADAVQCLGESRIRYEIMGTTALGVALGTYVVFATRHWDLLAVGLVALFFGAQYSLPPLRLKGRGLWQIVALNATLTLVPGLLIMRSLPYPVEWTAVVAIFGMGLTLNGIMIAKTAEDIPEDEQFGVRTSVRALGLERSFAVGITFLFVGGGLMGWGAWQLAGPSWTLALYAATVCAAALVNVSILQRVRGKPVLEGVAVVRLYTRYLPLYAPVLAWSTLLPAMHVLLSR